MKKVTILIATLVLISIISVLILHAKNTQVISEEINSANQTYSINESMETEKKNPIPEKTALSTEKYSKKSTNPMAIQPIPNYLIKSIDWLAAAQFPNGGWGAGQHSQQNVRNPNGVKTDPATTAFAAVALLRSGGHLEKGTYSKQLEKALDYLLKCVESTPNDAINITDLKGTQPQRKLGQNIDVSMAIQFFGRILHDGVSDEDFDLRINDAMDKCIGMLQESQHDDGSWNTAGWAPVLNSVMANNALEMGETLGKDVSFMLDKSKDYQKGNVDKASGNIKTDKSAGIALYSVASTQRATAKEAREAEAVFEVMQADGDIAQKPKTEEAAFEVLKEKFSENKAKKLASSRQANVSAKRQLNNDAVMSGFGNNGGEEFLSYMMASESFVAENNQESWNDWHKKMNKLFEKAQNENGSWTGQHCITSPVFCTAAVVMTLTADRDAVILAKK